MCEEFDSFTCDGPSGPLARRYECNDKVVGIALKGGFYIRGRLSTAEDSDGTDWYRGISLGMYSGDICPQPRLPLQLYCGIAAFLGFSTV